MLCPSKFLPVRVSFMWTVIVPVRSKIAFALATTILIRLFALDLETRGAASGSSCLSRECDQLSHDARGQGAPVPRSRTSSISIDHLEPHHAPSCLRSPQEG
jgi:hypothetical protein